MNSVLSYGKALWKAFLCNFAAEHLKNNVDDMIPSDVQS